VGLDRRTFLKLAASSVPALAGGLIPLLRTEARAARFSQEEAAAGGSWSRLYRFAGLGQEIVHAILLPDGHVLFAGGVPVEDTEVAPPILFTFDPATRAPTVTVRPTVVPVDNPFDSPFCGGHTYLSDGRVLFVGGGRSYPESGLAYSMLFDPARRRWSRIRHDMAGGLSWYATATRLPDARILVSSGFFDYGGTPNRSLELFDPVAHAAGSNPWRELISHRQNPWPVEPSGEDYTHTFLLPAPVEVDGHERQVVLVGKAGTMLFMNYTESFADPADRFAERANSPRPGSPTLGGFGASGVSLPDGWIMQVGGGRDQASVQRADVYDPVGDTWQSFDTGIGRLYPTALVLPDGSVLVVNGEPMGQGDPRRPTIIDVRTGRVATGPPWPDPEVRGYHNVALLLPDGRVLTAGGGRSDARYYLPPYLAPAASRPRITRAPRTISYGKQFSIGYANGPVHRVTLVALGAVTHFFNQNQGFAELTHGESATGRLEVMGPRSPSMVPPGHYLLFLLRRIETAGGPAEVPCVARIVRLAG
jgi:hypothetical protein